MFTAYKPYASGRGSVRTARQPDADLDKGRSALRCGRLAAGLRRLRLNPQDSEHYYNAQLWGSPLSAAEDAVIVFHKLERDEGGTIRQLRFNFVERKIFERDYTVCEPGEKAAK